MPLTDDEQAAIANLIARAEVVLKTLAPGDLQQIVLQADITSLKSHLGMHKSGYLPDIFIPDIKNRIIRVHGILEAHSFPGTPRGRPRFPSVADLQSSVPWVLLIGNATGSFRFQLPPSSIGLEKDPNYWWSKLNFDLPTGLFDFVVVGDSRAGEEMRAVPRHCGHTAMTNGGLVIFAGVIELNAGELMSWNNESGHYQPIPTLHPGVGHLLPAEKFKSF